MRLGSGQTKTYISGIYGSTSSSGIPVYINSNGQLGTQTSSVRFKEQVRDMGDSTSALMKLRPVTFLYKPEYADGERTLQYGLIAEEVAKVYPELVAYDISGMFGATALYDPYCSTAHLEEFNLLANPRSVRSLLFFSATWLRSQSVLFRLLSDHVHRAEQRPKGLLSAAGQSFSNPVLFSDLNPREQAQFAISEGQVDYYTHVVRQINRILDLDGVKPVFLLQPELILTRKAFTDSERRLFDYHRKLGGPGFIYTYEHLYPEVSKPRLAVGRHPHDSTRR
jgi:hypothetical protein